VWRERAREGGDEEAEQLEQRDWQRADAKRAKAAGELAQGGRGPLRQRALLKLGQESPVVTQHRQPVEQLGDDAHRPRGVRAACAPPSP
jgi:hypothetical protein